MGHQIIPTVTAVLSPAAGVLATIAAVFRPARAKPGICGTCAAETKSDTSECDNCWWDRQ